MCDITSFCDKSMKGLEIERTIAESREPLAQNWKVDNISCSHFFCLTGGGELWELWWRGYHHKVRLMLGKTCQGTTPPTIDCTSRNFSVLTPLLQWKEVELACWTCVEDPINTLRKYEIKLYSWSIIGKNSPRNKFIWAIIWPPKQCRWMSFPRLISYNSVTKLLLLCKR